MNVKRNILIGLFTLFMFTSGCAGRNDDAASASPENERAFSYDMEEIPVYENLSLLPDEQIQILDANRDYLLINIYEDYTPEDEHFRETGYNSESHRVVIFSLENDKITASYDIDHSAYVTSGIFIKNGFAFVTITLTPNQPSICNLQIHRKNRDDQQLSLGEYLADGFSDPRLVPLKNDYFAYSYYEENTDSFGVNTVDINGNITTQVQLTGDGKTEFFGSTLVGNKNDFLFFATVDSVGTFFIGDEHGIKDQFTLAANERVYDYCLLNHDCFLTLEIMDSAGNSHKAIELRDFNGRLLSTLDNVTYFRIVSDTVHYVLGIDMGYHSYLIEIGESGIRSKMIDCPSAPVFFYSIDNNHFLLHFNYQMNVSVKAGSARKNRRRNFTPPVALYVFTFFARPFSTAYR